MNEKKSITLLLHNIEYHYTNDQEMPETEQEHVIYMITQGYSSGELNDTDEATGWWDIDN